MPRRYDSSDAKRRILAASVHLFWEKGYTSTTVADILQGADVSCGTFQNIFHTKDGILAELVAAMFQGQFEAAQSLTKQALPPLYEYSAETAIQLTITELNENLRDIYLEAYTHHRAMDYIHQHTAPVLMRIFSPYLPGYTLQDFYELDLGTAGIMRGYMARPCDASFPLERKLSRFLHMSLGALSVPLQEQDQVVAFVLGLDIRKIACQVMNWLFESVSLRFSIQ